MKRAVIAGCGYFAGIHLQDWRRLQHLVRIEACCDVDAEAAQRRAAEFQIPRVYSSYSEMLNQEKPDFVDIVTRPDQHAEMLHAAADLGIPVLCQKPLAPTYEESVKMVEYCEAKKVRMMANENWRWQAWYRELKKLIASGVIGKPFYFMMRHRMQDGVGDKPYPRQPYFDTMPRLLLIETMIHFLDTARFLVGDLTMHSCLLRRVNPRMKGEDALAMMLEGADGLFGVIDGNRLSAPEQEGPVMADVRIEGSTGALSLHGDGRIYLRPLNADPIEHIYTIPTIGYRGDSVFHTLLHFLECLESGAEFETSGRNYIATTKLVFDGYRLAGW